MKEVVHGVGLAAAGRVSGLWGAGVDGLRRRILEVASGEVGLAVEALGEITHRRERVGRPDRRDLPALLHRQVTPARMPPQGSEPGTFFTLR